MESIKKTLEVVVSAILKKEGFLAIERKGLETLITSLLNYMVYTSSRLKKQCEMSRRTLPTLVDAAIIMQEINNQDAAQSNNKHTTSLQEMLGKSKAVEIKEIEVEAEAGPQEKEDDFLSHACTYVEYPQNYYEFFPKFPPAHTFKTSAIKRKITDDRAQKARLRNEQTKKIVENLFSIMIKSKKLPNYANYLI